MTPIDCSRPFPAVKYSLVVRYFYDNSASKYGRSILFVVSISHATFNNIVPVCHNLNSYEAHFPLNRLLNGVGLSLTSVESNLACESEEYELALSALAPVRQRVCFHYINLFVGV
jgi:hypothetical protein